MNVTEVTDKIKEIPLFKDIVFVEPSVATDSHYGTISVGNRTFKDSGKNEYRLGSFYALHVAHMYKDTKVEFFYLTFSRKSERRSYREHSFYEIEWNKIFASGNTVEKIIEDLNKQLINYELL